MIEENMYVAYHSHLDGRIVFQSFTLFGASQYTSHKMQVVMWRSKYIIINLPLKFSTDKKNQQEVVKRIVFVISHQPFSKS